MAMNQHYITFVVIVTVPRFVVKHSR